MAYSRRPILPPVVKNSVLRQKINSVLPQNPIEFKTLAFPSMKRKDINENSHGYFSIVAMCVFTIMGETFMQNFKLPFHLHISGYLNGTVN